jgi:hypothetical protein
MRYEWTVGDKTSEQEREYYSDAEFDADVRDVEAGGLPSRGTLLWVGEVESVRASLFRPASEAT